MLAHALTAAFTLLPGLVLGRAYKSSDTLLIGGSTAEAISVAAAVDSPRLTPINANATTYDWWYFDAVSASTQQSITVVFYNSGPDAFINTYEAGPFSVQISGSLVNGTAFNFYVSALGGMDVETTEDTIVAHWIGSGCSFVGTGLRGAAPEYKLILNASDVGIVGTVALKARGPSHYPCGPAEVGQTERIIDHVFWANAVPDAKAVVDLTVAGQSLCFSDGVGYHDKNWGDIPFVTATSSWYWGHAAFGPYSAVWFDAIDSQGRESVSGYVIEDGKVLASSCSAGAVVVRPWGANSDYPPTPLTGIPQGLEATFELDGGKTLTLNVTTGLVVTDAEIYVRALGNVQGGIAGEEQHKGRTLFEEFKI